MEESTPAVKKTTRTRKALSAQTDPVTQDVQSQTTVPQTFDELFDKLIQSKQEFDSLQKEIAQIKQDWTREQKQHELELSQQRMQEEVTRKRDEETYQYSTSLARKRIEDEFQDKKLAWEKELSQRKEELENQKKELEQLRKLAADFESQKGTAVKEAQNLLDSQLREKFDQEKKLSEQGVKAEKEIMGLKIVNLEVDNLRLNKEMEILKRSLDEATRQVKEIAVKVIESGSSQQKPPATSEA